MNKKLSMILAGMTVFLSSLLSFTTESLADNHNKYYCGTSSDGTPTTFVRRISGNLALIRWERDDIKDFPPQKRCELVSANFETASKNGYLGSLTGGFWKGSQVICATKVEGGRCLQMLFTIRPDQDYNQVIQNLISVAAKAKSSPVPQSNGTTRNYYSMEAILTLLEENEQK